MACQVVVVVVVDVVVVVAKQPTVPQEMDIASDVSLAREAAGFVAFVRRTVKQLLHLQTLMTSCVKHLMYVDLLICFPHFTLHF